MHLHSMKCTGSHWGLNTSYRYSGNTSRQVATWHRGLGSNGQGTLPHIAPHTGTVPLRTLHEKTKMSEKSIISCQIKHTFNAQVCKLIMLLIYIFTLHHQVIIKKFISLVGREGIVCLMPTALQIWP